MKKSAFQIIAGLIAIGFRLGGNVAHAQAAGSIDTSFGKNGIATATFNGQTVTPMGAVEQANGDIVVISQFDFIDDSGTGVGLTRFTPAGKLDTTFGTGGSTFTTYSGIIFEALWFGIQSNGAIVVAGGTAPAGTVTGANQGFGLARFTANGALDSTFGNEGLVNASIGPRRDDPTAFLLQPNGQIVMAGLEDGNGERPTNPNEIPEMLSLARYNSNGTLDPTFGDDGVSLLNVAGSLPGPAAIALLANGDYLAVGNSQGAIEEVNSTGALVSLSGAAVTSTSTSAQSDLETQVVLQANGSSVVTGQIGTLAHNHAQRVTAARFTDAGIQDTTFNTKAFSYSGTAASVPFALAAEMNGQVLVGGPIEGATAAPEGGLARLTVNGALDTTFGFGGTVTTVNPVTGLLIQTNGSVVAVESVGTDGIALQRFLGN